MAVVWDGGAAFAELGLCIAVSFCSSVVAETVRVVLPSLRMIQLLRKTATVTRGTVRSPGVAAALSREPRPS
eukprot:283714-Hanusia_phi.AAC.1